MKRRRNDAPPTQWTINAIDELNRVARRLVWSTKFGANREWIEYDADRTAELCAEIIQRAEQIRAHGEVRCATIFRVSGEYARCNNGRLPPSKLCGYCLDKRHERNAR